MDSFDLLLLAFKGIAIASLPLAAIWIGRASGHPAGRLGRLAWVTAFLTFDLVVFGSFTRLTDSGLGCPDWPGCYAKANPFMASDAIASAERAMPTGPVTMNKAWIEMIHRYLAMAVGLLIVAMLVTSIVRRRRAARSDARPVAYPAMSSALLALVVLQGAFGAWTVTQRLQPIFVTTHLLLGLSLLAVLVWHGLKLDRGRTDAPVSSRRSSAVQSLAIVAFIVLGLQIALGGWVSANYAVLACTDFPTCQGVWLPAMDFANGFAPWRELGRTTTGGYLSVEALTAIHWAHRSFAAVAFVMLGALAWVVRREPQLARVAKALASILVVQMLTGLANVTLGWPLFAAVVHNAGAAGLVVTLVVINYGLSAKSDAARSFSKRGATRALPVSGFDALH